MSGSELSVQTTLEIMWNNLCTWDQTVASAQEIIQENQLVLVQYQQEIEQHAQLSIKNQRLIARIVSETERLVTYLAAEKKQLLGKIKQTDKKAKVISGYLSPSVESVFIDKDF